MKFKETLVKVKDFFVKVKDAVVAWVKAHPKLSLGILIGFVAGALIF